MTWRTAQLCLRGRSPVNSVIKQERLRISGSRTLVCLLPKGAWSRHSRVWTRSQQPSAGRRRQHCVCILANTCERRRLHIERNFSRGFQVMGGSKAYAREIRPGSWKYGWPDHDSCGVHCRLARSSQLLQQLSSVLEGLSFAKEISPGIAFFQSQLKIAQIEARWNKVWADLRPGERR